MTSFLVCFGQRVRQLRRAADLTQEILAERAGVDPRVIRYVERADREVGLGMAYLIAEALGVPVRALFSK